MNMDAFESIYVPTKGITLGWESRHQTWTSLKKFCASDQMFAESTYL